MHDERVPADGRPEDAAETLAESALTGGPLSVGLRQGARLRGGGLNAAKTFHPFSLLGPHPYAASGAPAHPVDWRRAETFIPRFPSLRHFKSST